MRSIFLLVFIVILFYCSEKNVFKKLKQMGGGDDVVKDTDSMSMMIGASVIVLGAAAAVYFLMFDDNTKCNSFTCPDNSIPIEGNKDKACEGGICTLGQCCACGSKYTPQGDICVAKPDTTKKCSTDMIGTCSKGTSKDSDKVCKTCDKKECCKPNTCSNMTGSCPTGKSKELDTKTCTKCDKTECCKPNTCKYTYAEFMSFRKKHYTSMSVVNWVPPKEGESLTTDTYKSKLSTMKCKGNGKIIPECSKEGGKFTYTCKKPGKCDGPLKDLLHGNPGLIAKLKAGTDSVSCQTLTSFPRDCLKGELGLGKLRKKWENCHPISHPLPIKHPPPGKCDIADINHDGTVNIEDLLILLGQYNSKYTCKSGKNGCVDIDGNHKVNIEDLLILLGHFDQKKSC